MRGRIIKTLAPFYALALIVVAAIALSVAWPPAPIDRPTVVLGKQPEGERPASHAQFTYPETAVRNEDTIYIANALGGTIEAIKGDTIRTIFRGATVNDIVATNAGLVALDSGNAEILHLTFGGELVSKLPIPKMSNNPDADLFAASSLDVRGDKILISGAPVHRTPSGAVVSVDTSLLMEYAGSRWRVIATAPDVAGDKTSFRDAAYNRDGSIAVLAGKAFGVIESDGAIRTAQTGSLHGGGIHETDEGWIVGAHTQVLAISSDLQVSPYKLPMSFANVGDIQPDGDGLLITDTDRQVVYEVRAEVDDDGQPLVTAYGGGSGLKIADMAVGANGELLLLENSSPRVLTFNPRYRSIHRIAGNGRQERSTGGNRADRYFFYFPSGMAVASDGSVFVAEAGYRIVRIKDGRVTIYAGALQGGVPVEGQKLKDVRFGSLRGLDFDNEGRLLIVDRDNNSVWRVEKDDTISRVMGTGEKGIWKEGRPANTQPLNAPMDVLARKDGSILIADSYNNAIVGIDPQGIVRRFAGKPRTLHYQGFGDFSGDDGPALDADFNTPWRLAEGPDGSVYVVDQFNNAVRRIAPDGTISTVAGGRLGSSEDGTEMNLPGAVAVMGDVLYVADTGNSRVMAFPIK